MLHTMATMFVVLTPGIDAPAPLSATQKTHTLATLTAAEADALDGRRALYRVELDSTDDEEAGFVLYDGKSVDKTFWSVWLHAGQEFEDEMIVEATLAVIVRPATVGEHGKGSERIVEYRLLRAVVRRAVP